MAGRIWFCFISALAIVDSLKGSPNGKNASRLDSGKVIVKGNYNAVNLYPDREIKTAFSDIRKKLKSLDQRMSALEKPQGTNVCLLGDNVDMIIWLALETESNPLYFSII